MYLFPKNPKFRRIWIRNLRRDGFKVTEYSRLCAKHFTPDQFTTHPALAKKGGYKKLDLPPDAIPTLFDLPIEKVEKKPRTSTAFFIADIKYLLLFFCLNVNFIENKLYALSRKKCW